MRRHLSPEQEKWHDELQMKWKIIRTFERIITLPLGVNFLSGELVAMVQFVVFSMQEKRDNARVASVSAKPQ